MSRPMTWLLAGAALTLSAGAALADPAAAQRQAAEDSAGAGRGEMRAERSERREVRVYRQDRDREFVHIHGGDRSEHLRTMLQLRPEQDGALKTYLDAVGQTSHRDHVVKFENQDESRTTTQRLAEMEARMAEQQAAMRKRIDATKAFYAQLDEKQRKVFDAMPMLMFAGPSFGPTLIPVGHPMPPMPPKPLAPPRL